MQNLLFSTQILQRLQHALTQVKSSVHKLSQVYFRYMLQRRHAKLS
jgi:hypothetical protein